MGKIVKKEEEFNNHLQKLMKAGRMAEIISRASKKFMRGVKQRRFEKALKEEERNEIKECFELFDIDHSGTLDTQECKEAIRALGMEISTKETCALMAKRQNKDKGVDFELFSEYMTDHYETLTAEDRMMKGFQMFDEKGQGEINEVMLKRVCREIGIEMPEKTIKGMIDCFDRDQDGSITEQEFYWMMQTQVAGKDFHESDSNTGPGLPSDFETQKSESKQEPVAFGGAPAKAGGDKTPKSEDEAPGKQS